MTEDNCVWVYGVSDDVDPRELIGVGGGAARAVAAAGLVAIVGDVAPGEFGEEALRRNLEDLEWLEQTARTHHAVIEAIDRAVIPMRLATVYTSDERVAAMLTERAADLREALARITGRAEWGVKAYLAAQAHHEPPQRQAQRQRAQKSSGTAYLQRRRAELTARHDARRQALASADAIHAELRQLCVAARQYPPQSPEIAGRPASMVLNAAYLVPDDRADDFAAAVTSLAGRHPSVQLALTGPWPPYSFASRAEDPASRAEAAR